MVYILTGIGFGFADWYFVQALQERRQVLSESLPLAAHFLTAVNFLIWLLPLLPVVAHSARKYRRCWISGIAAALVWAAAMLAYYAWGGYLMATGQLPGWAHLNVHLTSPSEYHGLVWPTVMAVMGAELKDWIGFAVLAGFFCGIILCALFQLNFKRSGSQNEL